MWSPIFVFGIVLLSVYQVDCVLRGRRRLTWPIQTTTVLYQWQYPFDNVRPHITSNEQSSSNEPSTSQSPSSPALNLPAVSSDDIGGNNQNPHHHGNSHHHGKGRGPHSPSFRHSCPLDCPRPLVRCPKAPPQYRLKFWCGRRPEHKKGKNKKHKTKSSGETHDQFCEQSFPLDNGYPSDDDEYDPRVYTF